MVSRMEPPECIFAQNGEGGPLSGQNALSRIHSLDFRHDEQSLPTRRLLSSIDLSSYPTTYYHPLSAASYLDHTRQHGSDCEGAAAHSRDPLVKCHEDAGCNSQEDRRVSCQHTASIQSRRDETPFSRQPTGQDSVDRKAHFPW